MGDGSLDGFTESSCGRCPAFSLCEDDGPVNSECTYYDEWLSI
jgi:DNA-directed RNA polymerase III subunit RPC6